MSGPYVRVSGDGIEVCIVVNDEIDAEIVRRSLEIAAKRAARPSGDGKGGE